MSEPTLSRTLPALTLAFGLMASASAAAELVLGMQQEPTSLDPTADATASIDSMMTQNVFESLTIVAENGEVQPNLATSWEVSEDGLTYTFTLAEGVTFHDGSTLDADDVVYSFDRAMGEDSVNPSKDIFEPIESVKAVDPQTVEITLTNKDAFFLFNMGQGDSAIVASESVETNNANPVGSGPFKFDSWTRGDRLTLVKNPDHRDADDVALDKVVFRFISDPAAATAAMMAEELDAFPGFPAPELLPQFEADPRFRVNVGSTEGEVILAMNNAKPPFDNVEVRRAVATAIDRDEIIEGAMYGQAVPIGSFYPPHGTAYVDLTDAYPHDSAKAEEMFEAAGVAGATMTLRVPPFPYATRSAEIIQNQLSEAGIDAKVENVEWGFWIDEVYKKKNYDMTIIAHTSPNDMGNFARGPDYFYGYDNAEMTALWEKIQTEVDAEARNELLKQGQQMLSDQSVHGFLFQLPLLGVFRQEVEGYWSSSPVLYMPLKNVRIAD
ncbi:MULTISPECIES: ABC transporter substrate-binding protein [Sulfitobacter]|uniref:ABC transporter substrate-binding protein n=1 Tax=Sulfitobacter TaxID=60136 RepID=UPI002306E787|nr:MULTISPECIES: ABC transporter substrate-binding protein [Sulfitobacter]MDF3381712.1 ABC transporter substrate-binding protein [Sulfitobacter sp. Ks11]MDF3385131.1 ABC transporter substrate-binding protein [Sulfitobacter sp. M85]MDF3388550.1 ABC transporter substrate-binding protein [Sulfitobacter sp. Ks16]MDF3399187.1 ABC transporter substrate-binding protein [Sulfitobacter sp. KE39]MDF3402608.1 ABC transporter substrate-binding protein [Sulfitobacter sp. Ks35]